eukprot:1143404-Pelagomonas_calceolata.AAC.5
MVALSAPWNNLKSPALAIIGCVQGGLKWLARRGGPKCSRTVDFICEVVFPSSFFGPVTDLDLATTYWRALPSSAGWSCRRRLLPGIFWALGNLRSNRSPPQSPLVVAISATTKTRQKTRQLALLPPVFPAKLIEL